MILSKVKLHLIVKNNVVIPKSNTFVIPEKVLQFGTGVGFIESVSKKYNTIKNEGMEITLRNLSTKINLV